MQRVHIACTGFTWLATGTNPQPHVLMKLAPQNIDNLLPGLCGQLAMLLLRHATCWMNEWLVKWPNSVAMDPPERGLAYLLPLGFYNIKAQASIICASKPSCISHGGRKVSCTASVALHKVEPSHSSSWSCKHDDRGVGFCCHQVGLSCRRILTTFAGYITSWWR